MDHVHAFMVAMFWYGSQPIYTYTLQFHFRGTRTTIRKSKCQSSNLNTLRQRQHGRHFADDTFKCIFLNENVWIPIKISLKFVLKGPINNIPALFQIMAWRRPGDKPLSEPIMVSLPTHICPAQPQWVNNINGQMNSMNPVEDQTIIIKMY